jgi:hypothetical protein
MLKEHFCQILAMLNMFQTLPELFQRTHMTSARYNIPGLTAVPRRPERRKSWSSALLFLFQSRHSFCPATSCACVDRSTSISIVQTFVNVSHLLYLCNKELYHSELFGTDITD